jgi:hypothetical protein
MPQFATGGWGGPNKNNFFIIFKICFMFPGNDLHWRFYYADRQFSYPHVKMMIFTGP